MKKLIRIVAILLLLFNGVGALYGGLLLVSDPSGEQLQLSLAVLEHTPFTNFFIPGLVLLLVNGVFSFLVVATVVCSFSNYSLLVVSEGCLLTGWIIIQYVWTQTYHPLQLIMGSIGLLLVGCGCLLYKEQKSHYAL